MRFLPAMLVASLLPLAAVHATTWHVDAKAAATTAAPNVAADGSEAHPFATISAAAAVAQSGDTVLVQPGIYREHVAPPRGAAEGETITYRSAVRHGAVVRGSEVWQPSWEAVADAPGVFVAPLDPALVGEGEASPYRQVPSIGGSHKAVAARPVDPAEPSWPLTLGQLFLEGEPLTQATVLSQVLAAPGTWIVDAAGERLYLHLPARLADPATAQLELSVRDRVFAPSRRGLNNIVVEGFVFEHCANHGPFPQRGMVSVRSGKKWIVRDNIIRYAATVGIDVGSETWNMADMANAETVEEDRRLIIGGLHLIEGNMVSDNGLCGIAGWNTRGSRIVGNSVLRNNRRGFRSGINAGWEEEAGMKFHAIQGGEIVGNLVQDNDGAGIWLDNGYSGARVHRNLVLNNLGKGIFIELGSGSLMIDHNVVGYTRRATSFYGGDGIYTHDAEDITIAHNLIYLNARHGVLSQVVSNRTTGADKHIVATSGERVVNNVFIDNGDAAISLPLESSRGTNNFSDYNAFYGDGRRLFLPHSNQGRVKLAEVEPVYRARLAEAGVAETAFPDFAAWWQQRHMDLEGWRLLTGWDRHSVLPGSVKSFLRSQGHTLALRKFDALSLPQAPPVEGASDLDYFGTPLLANGAVPEAAGEGTAAPADAPTVRVGPFVNLTVGDSELILWPLPAAALVPTPFPAP